MTASTRDGGRRAKTSRRSAEPGPAPTPSVLHEAALAYLARGAATSVMLGRVLERRVATWARKAGRANHDPEQIAAAVATCRGAIAAIAARFREVGLLDDTTFAESRAQSLRRSGRSRRAIAAHLGAKGVDAETTRQALPDDATAELAAALAFARKRRIGPFAREEEGRAGKQKALAAMARAGFGWSTSERALGMDREQADERLHALLRR